MKTLLVLCASTVVALAGCGTRTAQAVLPTLAAQDAAAPRIVQNADFAGNLRSNRMQHACTTPEPGRATCLAVLMNDTSSVPRASLRSIEVVRKTAPAPETAAATPTPAPSPTVSPVAGYGPVDLQTAYGTTSVAASGGSGKTVAIVSVDDAATVEADMGVYRAHFGLPVCTSANRCFQKVSQTGTAALPPADAGWGVESTLDVQMVSANCPNCAIVLVEASSAAAADLAIAENTAARYAPVAISNSYVIGEWSGETAATYASAYSHAGIAITAGAGDGGYGVGFPAVYGTVIAVGGTSLAPNAAASRGFRETAWSGSGSGCSAYIAKPSWQSDTGCAMRTVADIAYSADPAYGSAIYDSTPLATGQVGWLVAGGTSMGAPAIAAMIALGAAPSAAGANATLYAHRASADLLDVTSGSNGTCTPLYLCTSGAGYDGPTGLGSPTGVGAL